MKMILNNNGKRRTFKHSKRHSIEEFSLHHILIITWFCIFLDAEELVQVYWRKVKRAWLGLLVTLWIRSIAVGQKRCGRSVSLISCEKTVYSTNVPSFQIMLAWLVCGVSTSRSDSAQ